MSLKEEVKAAALNIKINKNLRQKSHPVDGPNRHLPKVFAGVRTTCINQLITLIFLRFYQ